MRSWLLGRWWGATAPVRLSRVLLVVGTLLALVPTGAQWISSLSSQDGDRDGPRGDQRFVEKLDRARSELFTGSLVYTKPSSLELTAGEPAFFRAEVFGQWRAPQDGRASAKVTVGGQVAVKLHCSGAASCALISSKRQPVTNGRDEKEATAWLWEVTPEKAGRVNLALTVTSYYEGTETVLYEKPPIVAQAKVEEAPKDGGAFGWLTDAYGWVRRTFEELALLAGALSVILGLWIAWKTRNSPPVVAQPPPTTDGGPSQEAGSGQVQSSANSTAATGRTSGGSPPGEAP
ncbi:hypothetical protein [Streptomyces sp. NPDC047315]|uniref:hypothetical protein n=1 Tax=Streptomyces sp. NPDC047315 TaxID=3155142 RepID=UPI0033FE684A